MPRALFWCRLRGFAPIQKYYEWKKEGSEYEFWKKMDDFLSFVPDFLRRSSLTVN